jgi:ATP-dependent RNA helicase SUPV3L1/SUV3
MCFNTAQLPYLVATNAIGMGLNLNIRKIVFISVERPTSAGNELLEEHEIQQIAGRAGRGKETGYVQCANALILKQVEKAL